MTESHEKIAEALFQAVGPGETLYAILDGARVPGLLLRLHAAEVEHDSLYRGRSQEALWYVAPYLLRCERDSEFVRSVIEQGWGDSWGIFLTSAADLETLRKHLRQFLVVKIEDDQEVYFRFYDPRVLRVFLPTCTPEEANRFFGPVKNYLIEAEQAETLLNFTAGQQVAKREAGL